MAGDYYRWSTTRDVNLILKLVNTSGNGVTGATPEVSIRKHRDGNGVILDNYYWNGSTFQSGVNWINMTEFDATNFPGVYYYYFVQSSIAVPMTYLVYYRHTSTPIGFDLEEHMFMYAYQGQFIEEITMSVDT